MTPEEVHALVHAQSARSLDAVNHGITLKEALVEPQRIRVIDRRVSDGQTRDEDLHVWLVGKECRAEGYKIILSEDGSTFGLASDGFKHDNAPIFVGWYGCLLTTFLGM
jgi:hypothetical protein